MAAQPQTTIPLQPGIIYGPVRSRRLGSSLGVNVLPTHYKLCSFNCLYCQYGWTRNPVLELTHQIADLPPPEEVAEALEEHLRKLARHRTRMDSITFSGNGEPTLHPRIGEIVQRAKDLRDRYVPQAKLSILSNSATVGRESVRDALQMLDLKIMKLDAGSEDLICQLNKAVHPFYIGEIVNGLKQLTNVILQSLFIQGRVSNADPDSVELWLEKVAEIQPISVQVYSLDRPTPDKRISKVNFVTLQWIANQVHWRTGVQAEVY